MVALPVNSQLSSSSSKPWFGKWGVDSGVHSAQRPTFYGHHRIAQIGRLTKEEEKEEEETRGSDGDVLFGVVDSGGLKVQGHADSSWPGLLSYVLPHGKQQTNQKPKSN